MASLETTTLGGAAFNALLQRIAQISEDTCTPDSSADGRDYSAMAAEIDRSLTHHIVNATTEQHRADYLLALADVLCRTADGCAPAVARALKTSGAA